MVPGYSAQILEQQYQKYATLRQLEEQKYATLRQLEEVQQRISGRVQAMLRCGKYQARQVSGCLQYRYEELQYVDAHYYAQMLS